MDGSATLGGISAGLDVLSGVMGFITSGFTADIYRSRARMLRMEAEANAQRYSEQAAHFEAEQKVSYLASGVKLTGSPLDVLAETARVARANVSSIRAGGEAAALSMENEATSAESAGKMALVGGLAGGAGALAKGFYWGDRVSMAGATRNNTSVPADLTEGWY